MRLSKVKKVSLTVCSMFDEWWIIEYVCAASTVVSCEESIHYVRTKAVQFIFECTGISFLMLDGS